MYGTKRTAWAAKLLLVPLAAFAPASVCRGRDRVRERLRRAASLPKLPPCRPRPGARSSPRRSGGPASIHSPARRPISRSIPLVGAASANCCPARTMLPLRQRLGGVQHMRVVDIEPPRAMRLVGALGPLQSEALSATMTMTVKPDRHAAGRARGSCSNMLSVDVMRYKVDEIAPAVDRMLAGATAQSCRKTRASGRTEAEAAAPAGPPAPDAELAPVEPPAKGVVPLRAGKDRQPAAFAPGRSGIPLRSARRKASRGDCFSVSTCCSAARRDHASPIRESACQTGSKVNGQSGRAGAPRKTPVKAPARGSAQSPQSG